MSSFESFMHAGPETFIFRGPAPEDTRIMLGMTIYDLGILFQAISWAWKPELITGESPETLRKVAGAIALKIDSILTLLTEDEVEQALKRGRRTDGSY